MTRAFARALRASREKTISVWRMTPRKVFEGPGRAVPLAAGEDGSDGKGSRTGSNSLSRLKPRLIKGPFRKAVGYVKIIPAPEAVYSAEREYALDIHVTVPSRRGLKEPQYRRDHSALQPRNPLPRYLCPYRSKAPSSHALNTLSGSGFPNMNIAFDFLVQFEPY